MFILDIVLDEFSQRSRAKAVVLSMKVGLSLLAFSANDQNHGYLSSH